MANTKQSFLGLVKIEGMQTAAYDSLNKTGKLVFAHLWDKETDGVKANERFIINANGVEYKIATEDVFKSLEARVAALEAWRPDVDSSIDRLDSSVSALETLLADYSAWKTSVDASIDELQAKDVEIDASIDALKAKDTEIDSSIDRLDASVNALDTSVEDHETRIETLEGANNTLAERIADVSQDVIDISTYVHVTVNASIDALQAKDAEIDGSIGDISTRLSNIGITAADNSIGVNNTSIALAGDKYVSLTAANGTVTAGIKEDALVKGETHTTDVSLATKGYVDDQIAVLEQALVFIGDITSTADATAQLTDAAVQAGYTYVATNPGEYNSKKFDAGDLIIVKTDAKAGEAADIIVVERNLDGAVTAGAALDSDYVILGNGDQTIKASTLSFNDLSTAIANANSALQNVTASTSTGDYVTINAVKDTSAVNVSVGVKVATLADASEGGADFKALADARDVYERLAEVEEVMSTSVTTMAETLGMTSNLGVDWDSNSGIAAGTDYKTAIEGAYAAAHEASVTSFGGKTGAISVDTTNTTDGSVAFTMDGSTLKGTVVGWSDLVTNVSNNETAIGEVSTRVNEVSTRLNDLSTYVRQTVDASIDALQAKDIDIDASISRLDTSVNVLETKVTDIDSSIDRLDTSVSALETKLGTYAVKSIEGETGITARANGEYVAVSASEPDADGKVTLDASVQLAETVDLTGIVDATTATPTGLATDATVKDYVAYALAWEVIE